MHVTAIVPKLQGVVYCTYSTIGAENESVVTECVDEVNSTQKTKTLFNVAPVGLPLSAADIDSESASLVGKALRFQPSSTNSGCFIATITREVTDVTAAQLVVNYTAH